MPTIRPLLLVTEGGVPVALREATDADLSDLWLTLQAARPDAAQPPATLPIITGAVSWDRDSALMGTGSAFTADLVAGDVIAIGDVWLTVLSVDSDTSATVVLASAPTALPTGSDHITGLAIKIAP
jgi:hypothetical protein